MQRQLHFNSPHSHNSQACAGDIKILDSLHHSVFFFGAGSVLELAFLCIYDQVSHYFRFFEMHEWSKIEREREK